MNCNYFVQSSNTALPSANTYTSSNSTSFIKCSTCGSFPCSCYYNTINPHLNYTTYNTMGSVKNIKYYTEPIKIGEINYIIIYAKKDDILSILDRNNCSGDYKHEATFYASIKDSNHKINYSFDEDKFYQNDENNIEIKIKNKNHIKEILEIYFINEVRRVNSL